MTNGKRDYKKVIDVNGRTCQACHEYKTWDKYSTKTTRGKIGKQPKCKPCAAKETQKWYVNNKDIAKNTSLLKTYGITLNEYNARLITQDNKCPICSKQFLDGSFGPDSPVVDHCHKHGHVRGIICNECNRGLGYFRDNIMALTNAAQYLTRDAQTQETGVARAFHD